MLQQVSSPGVSMYSGAFFLSSCLIFSSAGRRRCEIAFGGFSDAGGCATSTVAVCSGWTRGGELGRFSDAGGCAASTVAVCSGWTRGGELGRFSDAGGCATSTVARCFGRKRGGAIGKLCLAAKRSYIARVNQHHGRNWDRP